MRVMMVAFVLSAAALSALASADLYYAHAQQTGASGSQLQTLNSATAYVNAINGSGYLIFYPNLTQAYGYLNKSQSALNASPNASEYYAGLAMNSAKVEYDRIESYKYYSALVLLVSTLMLGALIYLYLLPIKKVHAGRRQHRNLRK